DEKMNSFKRRLSDHYRHPSDPDHDALEDLHEYFTELYVCEYAEHGTMGGVDMTDLELSDTVIGARATMIRMNAYHYHEGSCANYTRALIGEIQEAAWSQVEEDWQDLLKKHQAELEEQE
ncbi:MAG: hypothetical protein IBX49_10705, partial [Gammaproteobacteria bacterium]|nr:hypothetical protein [Gammaproteobacteria bacterium]